MIIISLQSGFFGQLSLSQLLPLNCIRSLNLYFAPSYLHILTLPVPIFDSSLPTPDSQFISSVRPPFV